MINVNGCREETTSSSSLSVRIHRILCIFRSPIENKVVAERPQQQQPTPPTRALRVLHIAKPGDAPGAPQCTLFVRRKVCLLCAKKDQHNIIVPLLPSHTISSAPLASSSSSSSSESLCELVRVCAYVWEQSMSCVCVLFFSLSSTLNRWVSHRVYAIFGVVVTHSHIACIEMKNAFVHDSCMWCHILRRLYQVIVFLYGACVWHVNGKWDLQHACKPIREDLSLRTQT